MKFLQALRNSAAKLSAEFEDSKLFSHSGEKGEFREQIITQLLKPYLPACYGLGSGQVFSLDGNESNQIDVVIYDEIFSNVLFKNKNSSLFPCESVYGEIEIKSVLNYDEFSMGADNIASLKKLKRENSTLMDILPITGNLISDAPGNNIQYDKRIRNPYLGVMFAYDGPTISTMKNYISKKWISINKNFAFDFLFCYKRGYMILKVTNSGNAAPFGSDDFAAYAVVNTGSDTLPLMFLTLNTCLNTIRLKTPNYGKYWTSVYNESLGKYKQE